MPYVIPSEREDLVEDGLAEVCSELQGTGYGDLSLRLRRQAEQLTRWAALHVFPPCSGPANRTNAAPYVQSMYTATSTANLPALSAALVAARHRCVVLLGTLSEAEQGSPILLPFTEHSALLSLLLALRGSQPSVRRRQTSFQAAAWAPADAAPGGGAADAASAGAGASTSTSAAGAVGFPGGPALSSAVFSELPDPLALTDVSAATSVLLPQELGYPLDAYAGAEELQASGVGWGGVG